MSLHKALAVLVRSEVICSGFPATGRRVEVNQINIEHIVVAAFPNIGA